MAALALPAVLTARAQMPAWEMLPPIRSHPVYPETAVSAIDFLYGEGEAADDPAADSLVAFGESSVLLYNPSGAAGAAGSNGDWGAWHLLCRASGTNCGLVWHGLVTAAGSIVIGTNRVSRATHRGRVWQYQIADIAPFPLMESSLPALVGPTGAPALIAGTETWEGYSFRSLEDGAPGTWHEVGRMHGYGQSLGEVPPSAALPEGRILAGVWNGVTYSDDGGLSYTPSNAYGPAAYIAHSFAFLPDAAHPYGGVAYAGLHNTRASPPGSSAAEVHRSDNGGATWTLAHRFTGAALELPLYPSDADYDIDLQKISALLATPDGALWAGVGFSGGLSNPARGGIARSTDGGATWQRADGAFRDATGRGFQVNQLRLGRDGHLYAATERGVWRTTQAVVSSEASPEAPSGGVSLSVRPNPSSGGATVTVSLASASAVRVAVVDALGREVAVAFTGALTAGTHTSRVGAGLAPGVYLVQASAPDGRVLATTRLTITR